MQYKIEVFCDNDLNANTYLIYNDLTCFVIDPANNIDVLSKYIGNKKLEGILLTHGHYDHFKSINELLNRYDTFVYMHKNAHAKLLNPLTSYSVMFGYQFPTIINEGNIKFVKDGDKIVFGDNVIKCWYTPGHTDCMISYLLDDNLFSGDFIFKGSIGRCDLATSDQVKMSKMLNELKNRKTNYHIYPGHESDTTLFEEKLNNVYLDENGSRLVFE